MRTHASRVKQLHLAEEAYKPWYRQLRKRRHKTCSQDIENVRNTAPERAVGKALLPLRRLPAPIANVQQELFDRAEIISHLQQRSLRELCIISISESCLWQAACIDHYVR